MDDLLESDECARKLRALADPERLRIVQCLREGPITVSELAAKLDEPVVNISHHLGVLKNAGVVVDEKQGRFVSYSLHPDVFQPSRSRTTDHLNFGCCRIEIPKPNDS